MLIIKEYVERFVCAVERIASALEKGVEVNRTMVSGTWHEGETTRMSGGQHIPQSLPREALSGEQPAETTSTEQPGSDESKRSRPTKEEMAQRRAAAIEALSAAGLVLADVEAQLKAASDTWTSRHCEKAMALAAEKMPEQPQVPAATTPPPAETPKNPTEQDINAEKILALVEQVKAGHEGDTGASVAAAVMSAFGAGMAPNAAPVAVQTQLIAMLEASVAAAPKNVAAAAAAKTPATTTQPAAGLDPCPSDEKVFNYVRSLVGAKPIDTPADAEALIKSMQSGKPLALEQIRAVAAASVNSKRIGDPATINKLVATRANTPGIKLPEVDPTLYVAICHDLAAQADVEAM